MFAKISNCSLDFPSSVLAVSYSGFCFLLEEVIGDGGGKRCDEVSGPRAVTATSHTWLLYLKPLCLTCLI